MITRRLGGAVFGCGLLAVGILLVAACVWWPVTGARWRSGIIGQIERATSLATTSDGRMSFRLLPRPTVRIDDVRLDGVAGAIALDAASLSGDLDWAELLLGRVRLAGASLDRPTAVIDLDRLRPFLTPMGGSADTTRLIGFLHTPGLSLRSGVIRIRSSDPRQDTLLTDVTASFAWPSAGAGAALSGMATWRGVAGTLVADIDHPDAVLHGGEALASARLTSSVLDLNAKGALNGAVALRVNGKLDATTTDLPAFLCLIGMPAPQLLGIEAARLSGAVDLAGGAIALDAVSLTLDDMMFDGALAVHWRGERTSLAGTLATDTIDLGRFLAALPRPVTDNGAWSHAAFDASAIAYDDIDLRVSANAAKIGPFAIEDASLSLQSGDGRMELSVGEARAYDGMIKGRVVATLDRGVTDLRAEATVSRLDLGTLAASLPGDYTASGVVTGHLTVQSQGASPATLVTGLNGKGQFALHDGEVGGKLVAAVVQMAPSATGASVPLADGSPPISGAGLAFTVDGGVATLDNSWIGWPTSRVDLSGSASLPRQSLAVEATAAGEAGPGTFGQFALAGPWNALRLIPARPRP